MNKQKPTHQLSPAPRAHRVLFDRNLPFRPKSQRNVMLYQRNTRHRENFAGAFES